MKTRVEQRTERRRDAHLYGIKAESIAALLLRLKGYTILVKRGVKHHKMQPSPRTSEAA
jgi:hypothetical protein